MLCLYLSVKYHMFREFRGVYPKFIEVVYQAVKLVEDLGMSKDLFNFPEGQIAVQDRTESADNNRAGVGMSAMQTPEWEQGFRHIQPQFKDTAIEEYMVWLGVPVYRTRIMLSRPKTTYSIHRDYSPRLHLPLITNNQCLFLFTRPAQLIHMPSNGRTFWVDTRHSHTFLNSSVFDRLHLVMIVDE